MSEALPPYEIELKLSSPQGEIRPIDVNGNGVLYLPNGRGIDFREIRDALDQSDRWKELYGMI